MRFIPMKVNVVDCILRLVCLIHNATVGCQELANKEQVQDCHKRKQYSDTFLGTTHGCRVVRVNEVVVIGVKICFRTAKVIMNSDGLRARSPESPAVVQLVPVVTFQRNNDFLFRKCNKLQISAYCSYRIALPSLWIQSTNSMRPSNISLALLLGLLANEIPGTASKGYENEYRRGRAP